MAEITPLSCDSKSEAIDVTVSSPASFVVAADKMKTDKKNVKSVVVEGSVTGEGGDEHKFKFENCGYFLDGEAISNRRAIAKKLGGSATFFLDHIGIFSNGFCNSKNTFPVRHHFSV